MNDDPPTGKLRRTLAGTKTAAKVGGKVLQYYSKRPFLSPQKRQPARDQAAAEGAKVLFQGLALLKGTALKMAQQLSLESDLLPEAACRELAKAYHQVPSLNRALTRKAVQQGLGNSPEQLFASFETLPFASASLGQVHRARTLEGDEVAVKLQYPGIASTINGDVAMLRRMLAPLIPDHLLRPTLEEIAARLHEEVDYLQEAQNQALFETNLDLEDIVVARTRPNLCADTVLTSDLLAGKPLNVWLADNPPPQQRDRVAQHLNDFLVTSLYDLHAIQADPNPGNFLIGTDGGIGLVDFGCIKRFTPELVELYRNMTLAAAHGDRESHYRLLIRIGILDEQPDTTCEKELRQMSDEMCGWYGSFYNREIFDFAEHPNTMTEGKRLMRRFRHLRSFFRVNPDLIFLDRTRYGLLRIFEMLKARVHFRNNHEW